MSIMLTEVVRLVMWAALGSAASMLVYVALAPQHSLTELKRDIRQARSQLLAMTGGDDAGVKDAFRYLSLSLRQVMLTLGPALAGAIPILFLIAWVSNQYGFYPPVAGNTVELSAYAAPSGEDDALSAGETPLIAWSQEWPQPGTTANLSDPDANVSVSVDMTRPVPVIHKRQWWNYLFGNPLGYLPRDGRIEVVEIGLEERSYVPGVPAWAAGWDAVFFAAVLAFSLAIKVVFRIQ